MPAHLAPFEALRRDAERTHDSTAFAETAAPWLAVAHRLWSAARDPSLRGSSTARMDTLRAAAAGAPRDDSRRPEPSDDDSALVEAVAQAAARMEDAGALLLSATVLSALLSLAPDATPIARGRVLAQWARVERQIGELDVAADLYADAARLGRTERLPELRVRSDIGFGILARARGNYPEARARFRRALRVAERVGLPELTWLAHQGLMISAAVAGDFDTALTHGWAAFADAAGDATREADVLVNLGTLCLDAGQDEAALGAFLTATARATGPRTAIHAQAGAAHAAARLGRRELLVRLSDAVERATDTWGAPYAVAQWLTTLSEAWHDAGDTARAEGFRQRGIEIARAGGFAELVHRFESPVHAEPHARTATGLNELTSAARRVVLHLARLPAT